MALEATIAFTLLGYAIMPILWAVLLPKEEHITRLVFWYLSAGFLILGVYSMQSIILAGGYTAIASALDGIGIVLIVILTASIFLQAKTMVEWTQQAIIAASKGRDINAPNKKN